MATYDDYLKELERIADNYKREHIVARENEIKQLNAELAKLEDERKPQLAKQSALLQENNDLSKELRQRSEYNSLVQRKNNASTEEEYQYLAKQFRVMGSYEDSAKLTSECDEQYRVLKKRREEEQEKWQKQREREATERQREKEREEKQRQLARDLEREERRRLEEKEKQKKNLGQIFYVLLLIVFWGFVLHSCLK